MKASPKSVGAMDSSANPAMGGARRQNEPAQVGYWHLAQAPSTCDSDRTLGLRSQDDPGLHCVFNRLRESGWVAASTKGALATNHAYVLANSLAGESVPLLVPVEGGEVQRGPFVVIALVDRDALLLDQQAKLRQVARRGRVAQHG